MNFQEDSGSSSDDMDSSDDMPSFDEEDITEPEHSPFLEWESGQLKECQNAANIPHIFDMPTVPHAKMQVSFIIHFTHDVRLLSLFCLHTTLNF